MAFGLEAIGLSKIQVGLAGLAVHGVNQAVEEANKAAAMIVAKDATHRAPVLSGRLAKSVRPLAKQDFALVLAGGGYLPYAAPIHWGWPAHNIERRPFIPEAAEAALPELEKRYRDEIEKKIQKAI